MATAHELIDAQFDRAVEIVQGLPKTGPIQTDYEEKLQMYSLYKQATVGNVKSPRPGIWDMLGRAKWDAWAKHKDMESFEAKWLYVEALLKVLRRYSDKTIAQNLVEELESYAGDPSNLVLSRTSIQSPGSGSSGSTTSHDAPTPVHPVPSQIPPPTSSRHFNRNTGNLSDDSSSDDQTEDDEIHTMHHGSNVPQAPRRPHSSLSAHLYQTPITGSILSQASATGGVPDTQPLPTFETPSAFPAPSSASTPASVYRPSTAGGVTAESSTYPRFLDTARGAVGGVEPHQYRPQPLPFSLQGTGGGGGRIPSVRPASRVTLEHTIENVQAHLAALTERLETLESSQNNYRSLHNSASSSFKESGSPRRTTYPDIGGSGGGPSGSGRLPSPPHSRRGWDINDLGLWSHILNPISRAISLLHKLARFFASDGNRSPAKMIVRRLCLDLSFLMCVVLVIGVVWRKSGVRRREVKAALVVLWRAIVGTRVPRSLQDRGV